MSERDTSGRVDGRRVPQQRQGKVSQQTPTNLHGMLTDLAETSFARMGDARTSDQYAKASKVSRYTTELLRRATLLAREHGVNLESIPVPRTEIVVFQSAPVPVHTSPSEPINPDVIDQSSTGIPDEIQELLQAESAGRALGKLRRKTQQTQEMLAGLAGISKSAIDKLESGKRIPLPSTIVQLCNALGLDPEDARRAILQQMAVDDRIRASRNRLGE